MAGEGAPASNESDDVMDRIVDEEERVLARVQRTLAQRRLGSRGPQTDYEAELIGLRDQIREARLEDVPPLIEEMERLQQVAERRAQVTEGVVDTQSPYFGRLVLEENDRKREVLIGRSTFLDPKTGIRIVDWRDAPISRVYYRYEEGDDYEECFGDRDVEGEVLVRRALSISGGKLKRIGTPQGTFVRAVDGHWRRAADTEIRLSGGQGAAMRPEGHHRPGKLGIGDDGAREDKHLAEITALIDPRQFDLITKPTAGLVVIQGGAGSGKTTIGLHRLAYLAYAEQQRFDPRRMAVIVYNDALVRYISRVLPALGVEGVQVTTYDRWASRLRAQHLPELPKEYHDDTPSHVVRMKKHPALLAMIDAHAASIAAQVDAAVLEEAKGLEGGARVLRVFRETEGQAPAARLRVLQKWLDDREGESGQLGLDSRHVVERILRTWLARTQDVVGVWAELLTDRGLLGRAFAEHDDPISDREIEWCHAWCTRQCNALVSFLEEQLDPDDREEGHDASVGADGMDEVEVVRLDREDDALFLRIVQKLVGPLARSKGEGRLEHAHIFVDETQDLSPIDLAVILATSGPAQSVTLAGDVAQRLQMDNGFTDWRQVLHELGLDHVAIEPLRISYRSTKEIVDFSESVLGPLRNEIPGVAKRHGVPVELFRFGNSGEAVGFLAEALRNLVAAEPLASVAVIARYPEQADLFHQGLGHGEVPNLRRIADQDFPFRPGVDVTDVRQVKGLEFDYVVIVECNMQTFPVDDESRHLLHIAATRAAHQLWVLSTGTPSVLLPSELLERESG